MVNRRLSSVRRVTRHALIIALFVGCSRQPPGETARGVPDVTIAPVVPERPPVEPAAAVTAGSPEQPEDPPRPRGAVAPAPRPKPGPPTAFEYPADLGGKAVARAVARPVPPLVLTPDEKFGRRPMPRGVPTRLLDPEPVSKVGRGLPPVLSAKPVELRPGSPAEWVPADLGFGAGGVPAKPTFPVAAGVTERARDVSLPPAMPTLGRPLNDRVSLDDPTTEFGHAAVVAPPVKVPLAPAAFLKVTVPDPFELGDQVKPRVPPAAEPGLSPVPIDPRRVK